MPIASVEDAMHEFKRGSLHQGKGGPVVKSRKQAIAIGLSSARRRRRRRRRSRSLRKGR